MINIDTGNIQIQMAKIYVDIYR